MGRVRGRQGRSAANGSESNGTAMDGGRNPDSTRPRAPCSRGAFRLYSVRARSRLRRDGDTPKILIKERSQEAERILCRR